MQIFQFVEKTCMSTSCFQAACEVACHELSSAHNISSQTIDSLTFDSCYQAVEIKVDSLGVFLFKTLENSKNIFSDRL